MSSPVFVPNGTLDAIDIDPFVQYTWPIPVIGGETSLGFTARDDFDISISGRVLTLKYTGDFLAASTDTPIDIFASNSEFTNAQALNFRIAAAQTVTTTYGYPPVTSTAGSADIPFGGTIGDQLRVGDAVKLTASGTAGALVGTRYVVSVGSTTFQVAATSGGSPLVEGGTGRGYDIFPAIQTISTTEIFVGDTSGMAVGDAISLVDNGGISPLAVGALPVPGFVKQIVDGHHIKIASTVGGSAITAGANLFLTIDVAPESHLVTHYYPRAYPVITSAGEVRPLPGADVSYAITTDITADSFQVAGLPQGLTLVTDTIQGTAPSDGYFPVLILARLGIVDSLRYVSFVCG